MFVNSMCGQGRRPFESRSSIGDMTFDALKVLTEGVSDVEAAQALLRGMTMDRPGSEACFCARCSNT
eukprot:4439021-Amphidinium_carterae.1